MRLFSLLISIVLLIFTIALIIASLAVNHWGKINNEHTIGLSKCKNCSPMHEN